MNTNIHMGQIEVIPGRPDMNTQNIIQFLQNIPSGDLVIFPEMAIPGYMIGDKWLRDDFVKECVQYNQKILEVLDQKGIGAIWGNVDYDTTRKNNDGTMRKYNTAYVAQGGEIVGKRYKTLLPNYRMFDDKRYFTSGAEYAKEQNISLEEYFRPFELEIQKVKQQVGVLICEDIWNIHGDYDINPVELSKKYKMDLMSVVSCSPFGLNKDVFRKKLLAQHSDEIDLYYVNPTGVQDIGKNIHVFDGGSAYYKNGVFQKGIQDFTNDEEFEALNHKNEMEQVFDTLIYGIEKFFRRIGVKKAVIGLSGGIDSGVVAALLALALGKENVIAINMPSKFNSHTTKNLAHTLAQNLGIDYKIFPIQDEVDAKVKKIEQITGKYPTNFEIENIQARERGQILSDLAAHFQAVFTNNGNKDETALGYATLYGDVAGALAPIGDLHKFQVYELARFINQKFQEEIIPYDMIDLKASAELSAEQNPEQGGGDPFHYEFIGKLNRALLEKKMTPTDILQAYQKGTLDTLLGMKEKIGEIFENNEKFIFEIEKVWKLLHRSYFKRIQAPPIIQLSKASFGFDFREAQIDVHFGENYEKIKQEILQTL